MAMHQTKKESKTDEQEESETVIIRKDRELLHAIKEE